VAAPLEAVGEEAAAAVPIASPHFRIPVAVSSRRLNGHSGPTKGSSSFGMWSWVAQRHSISSTAERSRAQPSSAA
jgi:hypothetical protein